MHLSHTRLCLVLLLATQSEFQSQAFSIHHSSSSKLHSFISSKSRGSYLSSTSTENIPSCLEGVSEFEQWWKVLDTSNPSKLEHASFDSDELRGLRFSSRVSDADVDGNNIILSVPRDNVLQAPLQTKDNEMDWDANLSIQLLDEFSKGRTSDFSGYCSLLARGRTFDSKTTPPPTASNALRHWSTEEKQLLSTNTKGAKLLELQTKQSQSWDNKYNKLPVSIRGKYSKDLFLWAMEAVHSRAFCGDFGPTVSLGRTPVLASGIVQIMAIAFGIQSLLNSTPANDTDGIVLVCTLVAIAPIVALNFILGGGGDAVLLPMIDSANHLAEADSNIEYDPFRDGFGLRLGKKCLGSDGQVYVTYGENKSDSELLLNYGFLPNVNCAADANNDEYESYRSKLAETFVKRN